jgi:hypothetical protein
MARVRRAARAPGRAYGLRRRDRGQRCGGRHHRRTADAGRAGRGDRRGGAAQEQPRLPSARKRSLPPALPGERGAQDSRQGHQHPARALRGRVHHGQLDELLPHAGCHADLLAAAFRPARGGPAGHEPLVRAGRAPPAHRGVAGATEREQRPAAPRRREAGDCGASHPAQCEGLLESGLLRHGLPDECQAVDAGDHDPGGARAGRAPAGGNACAALRAREGPGVGAGVRAGAGQWRCGEWEGHAHRGETLCGGGWCDQFAGPAAAVRGA